MVDRGWLILSDAMLLGTINSSRLTYRQLIRGRDDQDSPCFQSGSNWEVQQSGLGGILF